MCYCAAEPDFATGDGWKESEYSVEKTSILVLFFLKLS